MLGLAEEKIGLAQAIYDYVDQRIRRLDKDLGAFGADIARERARLGVPVRRFMTTPLDLPGEEQHAPAACTLVDLYTAGTPWEGGRFLLAASRDEVLARVRGRTCRAREKRAQNAGSTFTVRSNRIRQDIMYAQEGTSAAALLPAEDGAKLKQKRAGGGRGSRGGRTGSGGRGLARGAHLLYLAPLEPWCGPQGLSRCNLVGACGAAPLQGCCFAKAEVVWQYSSGMLPHAAQHCTCCMTSKGW